LLEAIVRERQAREGKTTKSAVIQTDGGHKTGKTKERMMTSNSEQLEKNEWWNQTRFARDR